MKKILSLIDSILSFNACGHEHSQLRNVDDDEQCLDNICVPQLTDGQNTCVYISTLRDAFPKKDNMHPFVEQDI